jgi:hypothetical protein
LPEKHQPVDALVFLGFSLILPARGLRSAPMLCDQKCEFLPLLRTEHGVAVIRCEVDRPMPFLQFGFQAFELAS